MLPIFQTNCEIILASGSPRRQDFLRDLGLEFTVKITNTPEIVDPLSSPEENVCRLAKEKALAAINQNTKNQNKLIIAADTIVVLRTAAKTHILGKPKNTDDALSMLTLLAGQEHEVITAVTLLLPNQQELSFYDTTKVRFHNWPQEILKAYAHSNESIDKAGAYAVQGQGSFLIQEIIGSWTTVVGLPVTKLVNVLLEHKLIQVAKYL